MSTRSSRHARQRKERHARVRRSQDLRRRLDRIDWPPHASEDHAAGSHGTRGSACRDEAHRPPPPPLRLTPLVACDPETDMDILWHIAREAPELRRWLVANPRADAALLEFVAQAGGPGVREALTILLDG